ncbi:DUF2516 family protein [Actinocatenispora rupis]|uniref:DUF2516 domain-containing protein n=1 Tax=Actinocatenispora rupis TaxID=519421 RepID=A0A8J3JFS6_9ACTN|nr:DUF2516 family protein [Actinocatenispora rupis]GID15133.1 hypothetical protein Aru02nite_60220 [Actinocatenispora rupis]
MTFELPTSGLFAYLVQFYATLAISLFAIVLDVFAFVHCAVQRRDAFPAIGTLSKGIWLALLGGSVVLTFLLRSSPLGIIGMIGVIAGAVYVLDVRPGLKDATDGSGPW